MRMTGEVEMRTLAEFGYGFNDAGELRDLESGERFQFEVHGKGKTKANQRRYEALGEAITLHVFKLLEEAGLRRIPVPFGSTNGPQSFVFASKGAEEADALLILIHGTGVVRAGQWARRLIINHNLESGTQLSYIKRGLERGWGVLVLNTNYNRDPYNNNARVPHNQSPDKHGCYVWREWVRQAAAATRIAIVAHSAGGWVTGSIAEDYSRDFSERVKAVAFTDSFCEPHPHISKVGRNWVTSKEDLNTRLGRSKSSKVDEYSAGTTVHEETSWACEAALWDFLDERMTEGEAQKPRDDESKEGKKGKRRRAEEEL